MGGVGACYEGSLLLVKGGGVAGFGGRRRGGRWAFRGGRGGGRTVAGCCALGVVSRNTM